MEVSKAVLHQHFSSRFKNEKKNKKERRKKENKEDTYVGMCYTLTSGAVVGCVCNGGPMKL